MFQVLSLLLYDSRRLTIWSSKLLACPRSCQLTSDDLEILQQQRWTCPTILAPWYTSSKKCGNNKVTETQSGIQVNSATKRIDC